MRSDRIVAGLIAVGLGILACGDRPPHLAGESGDLDARAKDAPNELRFEGADGEKMSALMYAAAQRKYDAVEELLDAGADPNVVNERGWSAVTYACFAHDAASLTRLLAKGGDPVRRVHGAPDCQLANHMSRQSRLTEEDVVEVLLKAKVPIRLAPVFGQLMAYDRNEIVRLYLKQIPDEPRMPLLLKTVEAKRPDYFEMLLLRGAFPATDAERAELEAAIRKLDEPYARVFSAALAPGLTTPGDRAQAVASAENRRKYEDDRTRPAREREAADEARRKREEEERRQNDRIRAMREREREAAAAAPSPPDTPTSTRASEPSRPAPAGYEWCGGVLCGTGYVCCVGAVSQNFGVETCRQSPPGCKQGWDAETLKNTSTRGR